MPSGMTTAYDTSLNIGQPIMYDKVQYDQHKMIVPPYRPIQFDLYKLFKIAAPITIVGWEGGIGGFGPIDASTSKSYNAYPGQSTSGMALATWLSLGAPQGKMGPQVFGWLKTGDTGSSSGSNTNIALNVLDETIYLNWWAQNMRRPLNPAGTDDWDVDYTIYYVDDNSKLRRLLKRT